MMTWQHNQWTHLRPTLGSTNTLRSSIVQAFDENGEALILRGPTFHWDSEKEKRSPHLPENQAHEILQMVLDRYRSERRQLPRRIVVHKSSRFDSKEKSGFERALRTSPVEQYDLISLRISNDVRLIRYSKYNWHDVLNLEWRDRVFVIDRYLSGPWVTSIVTKSFF